MKKNLKSLFVAVAAIASIVYSCETFELEQLTSPNALSPSQADPDLLLNSIQLAYLSSTITFNNNGANTGRIDQLSGTNYFNSFGGGTMNNPWNQLYSGMIPDIAVIESLDSPDLDLSFHIGVSKILQADVLLQLVDWLGDIAFSQANNPSEFPTPMLDDDADVYTAALALLDEGIAKVTGSNPGNATDLYYGGDASKWVKLGNSIKMRANLNLGNYSEVVNATNVIESTEDDFEFKYGTNQLSPDNRHPDYVTDYRSDGAGIYMNNWLMNLMIGDFGDFSADTDPRRRYYWYRQTWIVPGNYALFEDVNGLFGPPGDIYQSNASGVQETLSCSVESAPTHLQFTPDEAIWCSLPLGYWARFHGNNRGTPPDNFLRTAVGLYPAGGSFDGVPDAFPYVGVSPSSSFPQQVGFDQGGGGAGIEPIMLASWVDFMKAEANLQLGNNGPASVNFESGMTKSINKVMSFESLDPSADFSQVPTPETVVDFINLKVNQFNAAPSENVLDASGYPSIKGKMELLGEQYFIAQYGAGADAFNFIRRTGYPQGMSRNFDPNPGDFPSTVLYPTGEVSANPNVDQRTDLNTKVFWDQGLFNPANNQ